MPTTQSVTWDLNTVGHQDQDALTAHVDDTGASDALLLRSKFGHYWAPKKSIRSGVITSGGAL